MSGICGIIQPLAETGRARLDAMLRALKLSSGEADRRLAGRSMALGVSQRWDFQQVASFGGIFVAADADLYNQPDLEPFVARSDIDASGSSVAEFLGRLYLAKGPDFVELIQGAFSIAIWDEAKQELLLAVDRFGFKTLYWSRTPELFLFASRVGAVRAAQDVPSEINPAAIAQFLLYSVVPAPLAVFRDVQRMEPGFRLTFKAGEVINKRYWDLEYREDPSRNEQIWARELREEMRSAVHRHLEGCSEAGTGAYLSGGTDSSSVVAFMSDRFKPVKTFSISFPLADFNEIGFARTTVRHFSTRHHECCLTPKLAAAAIPKIVACYDEPFANSSAIASYYCAALAQENGIDTLLAGDGGDELFGGNARYASDKQFALYSALPTWVRRGLIEPIARLLPTGSGKLSLLRRYIRRAQVPNPRRILSYNFFLTMEALQIFEPDFLAQAPESEWVSIAERHFRSARASHELNRLLYMDVKMTLADNDLRKVSGTAELAGVRVRYPLLDTRLAEFSGRIPARLKLKGMEKRYIFKKAMSGILPDKVLFKKKHGFGVPLGQWFLHEPELKSVVVDTLGDARTRQRGYFRRGFLEELKSLHEREDAGFYGEILWYVVALELWHRKHAEPLREVSIAG